MDARLLMCCAGRTPEVHAINTLNDNKRKALRLAALADYLRDAPHSKDEILLHFSALGLSVSRRGVERCLRDLHDLQLGLDTHQERLTSVRRYFIPRQAAALPPVQALLTHSAVRLLYHHTPGYNALYHAALEKLAAHLPEPAQALMRSSTAALARRRGQTVQVGESQLDLGRSLELVAQGWFERRRLGFDYRSAGRETWKPTQLEVYFVELSRGNLAPYLIGFSPLHGAIRTFKVSRMRGFTLLSGPGAYHIDPDFDPSDYLEGAWGVVGSSGSGLRPVRLRFAPEVAYRILEGGYPWLRTAQAQPDGSLEVTFEVGTSEQGFPLELLSWVLSWGASVQVLEPESLRARCLTEARRVLGLYSATPDQS